MQIIILFFILVGYMFLFLLGHIFVPLFFDKRDESLPDTHMDEDNKKLFAFLLSPLIGAGVWTTMSMICGMLLWYDATTLGVLLASLGLWMLLSLRGSLKHYIPQFRPWLIPAAAAIAAVAYISVIPILEWEIGAGYILVPPYMTT